METKKPGMTGLVKSDDVNHIFSLIAALGNRVSLGSNAIFLK